MIYLHHDLYSNFSSSLKSGDLELSTDILVNEISDFIVFDTKNIVQALNKAGIKSSEDETDEELVDSIIENISTNKKLAKTLAFIIANANELINNGKGNKESWAKIIDTIAEGITAIGNKMETNKIAFKEDILQHIITKAESKGDYKRIIFTKDKSSNIGWYILGGTALFLTIVYFISKYQQRNLGTPTAPIIPTPDAALNQMANGGAMSPITPPIQTPIASMAPVSPITVQPINTAQPTIPTTISHGN